MPAVPKSRLYCFIEQGMHFRVTVTLQALRMARWIRRVQREILDRAPQNSMCVGLDCEYTDAVKNVKQKNLPSEKKLVSLPCNSLWHRQMQCQSS
jgi:hypothetical protein